jgi:predicted DNA-binding transcriptional regulator AlpA
MSTNHQHKIQVNSYLYSFLMSARIVEYRCMQPTTQPEEPTAQHSTPFGLLTPAQLASQLGVTTRTLQRWEVERTGPPRVVIGKQVFYRTVSVLAWVESCEQRRGRAR